MRYFDFIESNTDLFYKTPSEFNINSTKEILSHSLGAMLYMSGLRQNLTNDIQTTTASSVVICLEDAVSSDKVKIAEENVINFLNNIDKIAKTNPEFICSLPLLFLRIRDYNQLVKFLDYSSLTGLCGIIFPKFTANNGEKYLHALNKHNKSSHNFLYGLPILETHEIIHKETRFIELLNIKTIIDRYRDLILNIRIGGTDFSGIYGLRRDKHHTIYDLAVIRDCICDIINIFKIDNYVVSAPVNEFFSFSDNLENCSFVREIKLDIMNGLTGKTVIHPNQVDVVNSLMVVSKEDYLDAKAIVSSNEDGVIKSLYNNKMNEIKPHLLWAKKILLLSKILGVLNHGKDYRDILALSNYSIYRSEFENIAEY
jgi:citrate lyase beta subunit